MKIAFFTDSFHPDLNGVVMSVDEYAQRLRDKGHTVYIVAPLVKGFVDKDKFVLRVPAVTLLHSDPDVMFPIPVLPKQLMGLLKLDVDIIHAHGNGFFSLLGHEVARAKRIPFVMTFHNLHTEYTHYFLKGMVIKPSMMAAVLRIFANMCDGVLTPSEKMRQHLVKFGVKKKITLLPNFVDLSKFSGNKQGFLHAHLGLDPKIPLFLSVGRLGKEKNFPYIFDAFKKFMEMDKTAHLVIVGGGVDHDTLIQRTKDMGIDSRVHLIGKVPQKNMPEVYADADVFVFASTTEVHPLVVLEAVASGLPVVAVDDLAFKDIVTDGVNGFCVSGSPLVFAQKMEEVLSNKKVYQTFHENALKMSQQNIQADDLTRDLLNYYDEVLAAFAKKTAKPFAGEFLAMVREDILQINMRILSEEKHLRNMLLDTVSAIRKFTDRL